MTVSVAGEIFVNDGNGIAVFGPAADGNADPERYIVGKFPGNVYSTTMVVDVMGNLYLALGQGVAVFGPKDTGAIAPWRVINVPSGSLATDSQGNLTSCVTSSEAMD